MLFGIISVQRSDRIVCHEAPAVDRDDLKAICSKVLVLQAIQFRCVGGRNGHPFDITGVQRPDNRQCRRDRRGVGDIGQPRLKLCIEPRAVDQAPGGTTVSNAVDRGVREQGGSAFGIVGHCIKILGRDVFKWHPRGMNRMLIRKYRPECRLGGRI